MGNGVVTRQFGKELRARLKRDRITNGAAALAFYWMLALFPAAIFVLSLLPYLPVANLEQAIMDLLKQSMPGDAASMFEQTVRNVVTSRKAGLLSFGFVLSAWSASSGVHAVMQELNAVHEVEERRPFWKVRGTALLLTLGAIVLVLGSLALAVLGGVIQGWLARSLGSSAPLLFFFAALRWVIIGTALLLALALVYHFGPAVKEGPFRLVTPGSVVGTLTLALASLAFKLYVANFGSYDKTYGSLGAVIALLMWLFVTGLVLLVGAEVDVLAKRRRERRAEPRVYGPGPQHA
jgi:membrane protein